MKRKYSLSFIAIVILLALGVTGCYVNNQIGKLKSSDEREGVYSKYSYYSPAKDEFISPKEIISNPEQTTGGNPGFLRFFKTSPNAPEFELPKQVLTKSDFPEVPSTYAAYWLGHSTAIIELDGYRILIDPVFGNAGPLPIIAKRMSVSPLQREELPAIDIVIITHDHYDHLETETIKFLADKNIQFIVPLAVGARLEGWGVPKSKVTELAWHQTTTHGSLNITATPTVHYSGRSYNDKNKTLWASYVIKGEEKNLYWSGDTGYGEHFKEIGRKYGPFDLAFMEIDAWNKGWPNTHLFPEQVIKACQEIDAALLFPIHFSTFDLALHPWDESIGMVADLATQNNIKIVTPIMGEKVIPGTTPTTKWWKPQ
ncbi:MBL fold metallo-hydrolase [Pontibacter harenae]|uniref:MBL fold metallo-hydrolase n=1 Tax=Pontibacter harenae TaxID=2894083 RepID=UPI001E4201F6|nr:MBL fold metallo-hydrolase [Pontibacter harenae]MCC9168935.1 MBL fold metallo-hydrolase [Pontibacter harenae]